ncbi:unnamed protein product [Calypogeia fissa]
MAVHSLGTKSLSSMIRRPRITSSRRPFPRNFAVSSLARLQHPDLHPNLHPYRRPSAPAFCCLKAILCVSHHPCSCATLGNSLLRADWSAFTKPRILGQEFSRTYAQHRAAVGVGGSASLNLSEGVLSAGEEQQQTNSGVGKMVAIQDTVELTELEERIFGILAATLNHFNLKTQLRVAGGWVRDKLLGKHSKDIDIALDDMLGRVFCEKVNEYLKMIGEETHSVGVIQSNPDQSKHLETANMRILGMSIDFVNLRAETYTESSRIPQMEFGTPEQDAERRDLTINSLFYNINTKMVEDFTSKGKTDLKLGIIRTPLPPNTTFLDDPLRVCRAIRFGARFNFTLDEELKKAAASDAVRTNLENKVSRERIGHEVELMIMGNQPEKAMKHIDDLSLFSAIFPVSKELEPDPPILENYGRLCVDALQAVTQIFAKIRCASEITNEQRRLLLFGALFLPLHPCTCFLDKRKKKKISVSRYIISESLKLKNNDASGVETLHTTALKFQPLIKQLLQPDSDSPTDMKNRVELGLLFMSCKELWRGALVLASILELPSLKSQKGADIVGLSLDNQAWIDQKVEICNAVEDIVMKLGLNNVWETRPLLDGHKIMDALKLGKGGRQVQEWKEKVMRWQLSHPESKSDECLEWLLEENVKRLKTQ